MSEKSVDYLDVIARIAEEDRRKQDSWGQQDVSFPEPQGEKVIDYLAVSKEWKKQRNRLIVEREQKQ